MHLLLNRNSIGPSVKGNRDQGYTFKIFAAVEHDKNWSTDIWQKQRTVSSVRVFEQTWLSNTLS